MLPPKDGLMDFALEIAIVMGRGRTGDIVVLLLPQVILDDCFRLSVGLRDMLERICHILKLFGCAGTVFPILFQDCLVKASNLLAGAGEGQVVRRLDVDAVSPYWSCPI